MFGDRLKELRSEKHITQHVLADMLNISRYTITKYETNERIPDIDTLIKIADFFDVSLDFLMDRQKSRKEKIALKIANRMYKLNLLSDDDESNAKMINAVISILKITKDISAPTKDKSHE